MKIEAWDDFLLTKSFWNIILKFNSLQKCVQFSDGLEINIIFFFFFYMEMIFSSVLLLLILH